MAELMVEYFMVDGKTVVPAELRFLECQVPADGNNLVGTTKWMTPDRWRELVLAVTEIISSSLPRDGDPTSEPAFICTENLKLAYIFKLNNLQKQILMNLQLHSVESSVAAASTSLAAGLSQHNVMLSVGIALANNLNNTQADTFRSSLGCSVPSGSGNKQPTINNYFATVD